FHASISRDGATVLYLAASQLDQTSQAWTIHPDGTGRRQLTDFRQDVSEAVLSGNGQTVVAVTGGRMISIDIATSAVGELIATSPTCFSVSPLVPGSLATRGGTGLASSTRAASAPLPVELGGVRVLMNGAPLPLLSVSSNEIWLQVPWEASPGTTATFELGYG